MVTKPELICGGHLCQSAKSHQTHMNWEHSPETSTERMPTPCVLLDNAVRLERPISLVLGCALPKEAVAEAVFVDFSKHSHSTSARNYHLNVLTGMVQALQKFNK